MRDLTTVDDPGFNKKEEYNFLDRFFLKFIRDERDLPFVHLCILMTLTIIPFAVLLFSQLLSGSTFWIASLVYLVLLLYFIGPYTLMLHNTSHRPFFKRKHNIAKYYIPWVLGPFVGQSPETYFSHHIGMHHAENNLLLDKSSTMFYQRDSFIDFMKYYGIFMSIGIAQLINYFKQKKRKDFIKKILLGEFSFIFMCVLLCFVNWQATAVVFIFPFLLSRFGMMAGNWGQHAFIDADTPANNYRNSITIINSLYNKRCFNDGYHIGHHLRPHMHWTDMPSDFLKNKTKYVENNAIVFEGLDFQMVWFFLMIKRYDLLADRFVNINNQYQSKDEVIALLKERARKFDLAPYLVKASS